MITVPDLSREKSRNIICFSKFYFMGNNDYCFNSSDLK